MSQVVSSIAQTAMQQGPENQLQKNQTQPKTSFEETLQKTEEKSKVSEISDASVQKTQESFNNPAINQIQTDLQNKYQQIPQISPTSKTNLLPDYEMLNGRMSVLREMNNGLTKAPTASGLQDYRTCLQLK